MKYLKNIFESLGGCPLDNDKDKQEIMDLCEPFMIPLMDDDEFEYYITKDHVLNYHFVMLVILRRDRGVFYWDQIRDNVIPMFHMLCKKYMTDSWSAEKGEDVHFFSLRDNIKSFYSSDIVFNDFAVGDFCRAVGLKLYQKRNYVGRGMRFEGERKPNK